MADLFLSYAREDRACAEMLAGALARRGWSVWWDRRIQVGRSFSEVIERELDQARCVLVLWSSASIQSQWVQNEAAEAARKKRLVPVRIEDVRPPLEFRRLQTADLFDWKDGLDRPDFVTCLQAIEFLAGHTASKPIPPYAPAAAPPRVAAQPQPQPMRYAFAAPALAVGGRQPVLALVLSALIVGVGQFYNGDVKKGAVMLVAAIVAGLLSFGVGWFAVAIWSAWDAYQVASGKAPVWA
ncbi:MAG TPA: toll/interleukin-1 receptor domain-containing protein [Thermoanaerobaculia bacterium]|jgi:TM2 domain-containing membrane protein YozV|nr:toll/interleukin-1 receptor domain-containing protein [Thermoanaerobaculia bacterium]